MFASPVTSQKYPDKKAEVWWIIVGVPSIGEVIYMKKLGSLGSKPSLTQKASISLNQTVKSIL